MISIGGNYNGPELQNSAIRKLIGKAMNFVADYRGDWVAGKSPGVNIVFYVPGSLGDFPDIPHLAAGRFSRKQKLLLVEVPVPRDVAKAGGSIEFVVGALRQANAVAADVFAQKKVGPFDLAKAEAIVDQVEKELWASRAA